jgi:hypothetical protein
MTACISLTPFSLTDIANRTVSLLSQKKTPRLEVVRRGGPRSGWLLGEFARAGPTRVPVSEARPNRHKCGGK